MKIDLNIVNEFTRELKIELPWDELKSDFDKSIKKFSKKIKMPGFRPGKTPKARLLQQFQQNIEADFMEDNFQKYYLSAINQEKLLPVNQAEITDVDFKMDGQFSFKAKFEVEPKIVLPELKKNTLKVQKIQYIHDKKDIDDAIHQLRKTNASMKVIEEGAEEGDYLVCDLQKLDESGVPIIGKNFQKQYLRVGNGSFTDNQKDKLIGLKKGEKTRLKLPINKEGSEADYELTIQNIERELLPELDEKFIKSINPDLKSVEDLTSDVENKIKENFEERSKTAFERDLSDALIKLVNPSFSPSMVSNYIDNLVEDVKKQNNGEPLDENKVREHYKAVAERNIKWYSIRKKIIEDQKINISKENIDSEINRLVEVSPKSENEIRTFYKKPSSRKRLEDDLTELKIMDYLKKFSKVKEVKVATKELRGKNND
ncbi:MAG: trigger factor [Candidatus Neomarinimicrobiota bacterium]